MLYRCVSSSIYSNIIRRQCPPPSSSILLWNNKSIPSSLFANTRLFYSSRGAVANPEHNEILLRDFDSKVLTLTLNRPKYRNALSNSLLQHLRTALTHASNDPSVHVIVIQAAGDKVFSSGHDLKEIAQQNSSTSNSDESSSYHENLNLFQLCSHVMMQITNIEKPVIAKVNGIATAAGCQLVASCDLAIATHSSQFATPGVNLGLFCSTPAVALTRIVPKKHAMKMLLTGDMMTANEAKEMGLINQVVSTPQELNSTTADLAQRIASKSPLSIAIGKRILKEQMQCSDLAQAYEIASKAMAENLLSLDAQEGIDAFLNKRKPIWPSVVGGEEPPKK